MTTTVTFHDNRTFRIGQRVTYMGLPGTVIGIRDTPQCVKIQVQLDEPERLTRRHRWMLNPEAAKQAGRPDYDELRDIGLSAGNFQILEA